MTPAVRMRTALAGILAAATALYTYSITSLGWGNAYYSAAVKSMGQSWTNFLFGAYDPAGVVTVDKPPAALWPQVVSTKIFGMHGWAVLLPQAVEGVLAVALLYLVVRRWAGPAAGLIAAAVMTVTPITVAINRDNNPDTLLVLFLVGAAYAATRAVQGGTARASTLWLCACGLLVGAGFLTKMLVAWMVAPAFVAAWLVGSALPWWPRIWRLLAAGVVLAASSLWWVGLVAVWPGDRPYVGGSTDGSAWDLVIGYNGLGRVFGEGDGPGPGGGMGGGGMSFGGAAGWGRLFGDAVAGQISWLLPACAVALVVAVVAGVLHRRGVAAAGSPLPHWGWAMWAVWLVVCGAVFSLQQGIFHPYYTTLLAPAVGALCGGLVTALRQAHAAGAWWALPVAAVTVAGTAAWAFVVIARVPSWFGWLRWVVLGAAVVAALLLVAARWRGRLLPVAVLAGLAAVLVTPAVWSGAVPTSTSAMGGTNPTAGPAVMPFGRGGGGQGFPGGGQGFPGGFPGGDQGGYGGFPGSDGTGPGGGRGMSEADLTDDQRKILDYAVRTAPAARISLAVDGGAMSASAFILGSDATVVGMGGFSGMDDAPSVTQLRTWTASGELRYVLASAPSEGGSGFPAMPGGRGGAGQGRTEWISANCRQVPAADYGGQESSTEGGGFGRMPTTLYDCAPA